MDLNDIYKDPCQKINPWCIDAYFDLSLDDITPTDLTLGNSWEDTTVDLTPAIKAGETITSMFLTPSDNPTALQYNREDYGKAGAENSGIDCISGDELSRIISMKYLKDVSQNTAPTAGDTYMYDGNYFQPFNLQQFVSDTNATLQQHTQTISNLQQALSALQNQVNTQYAGLTTAIDNINTVIAKPSWAPASAVLAWGTTNTAKNSAPSTQGIWTHNPSNNVLGDTRFD